ncbi:MAG: hypothetical protein RLZZ06_717, partial [Actinomycetota bacterium]
MARKKAETEAPVEVVAEVAEKKP